MKVKKIFLTFALLLSVMVIMPSCAALLQALEDTSKTTDNSKNNNNNNTNNNTQSNTSKGKK